MVPGFVTLLTVTIAAAAVAAASMAGGKKFPIFLLAGQSNMSGRGGVTNSRWDCVVPAACNPIPGILRLSAGLRWEEAREPLHADIDTNKTCGVGPGMPFAHAVLSTGAWAPPIGLVPCAVGGSTISQWARGTDLYRNLVRRAREAVQLGGKLQAVLWFQGESDTIAEADAEAYADRMRTLILDLRRDLGDPDLIVIQVALASGEGKYVEAVRRAQKGIELSNVLCIDAKGLPLETDWLHLTTQAQVILGNKLADAFLNFALPSNFRL